VKGQFQVKGRDVAMGVHGALRMRDVVPMKGTDDVAEKIGAGQG